MSGSRNLVDSSVQAWGSASGSLPAAGSWRGKCGKEAVGLLARSFFLLPEKPSSFDSPPQQLIFRSLTLNDILVIGRFLKSKPHPSHKFRHSLVSLPVTQHFFQLIGFSQAARIFCD